MSAGQRDLPDVTVVIPCYQHSRFLPAAIESALKQTTPARQIIVVDDGSTDGSTEVARQYAAVDVIQQPNRGLAAARNAGLRAAAGEKVVFLDADDRLLKGAIAAGLACFERHPDAAFVYGGHIEMTGGGPVERFHKFDTRAELIQCNWVAMIASAMFDRKKLASAGGFDEGLGMCEDWDAYLRLSRSHSFAAHSELVAVYVKHSANMSNDVSKLEHWIGVVRNLERQRGLSAEEEQAWHDGASVWRAMYPAPSFRQRVSSALRRIR